MRFTKKLLAVALVLMMVLAMLPITVLANAAITVTIDGVTVEFEDQTPVIVGNRTLVPIRFVFEDLGFEVDWDRAARTATLERADYVIVITIGSDEFTINGDSHTLEVPAQLIGGRVMIPVGAVLLRVGYDVTWVAATRTVVIETTTPQEVVEPPVEPDPEPDPVDEALQEFLALFDLDLVREILGTDFEAGSTDEDGNIRWSFLALEGEPNVDLPVGSEPFASNWDTEYNDAILILFINYGYAHLKVDVGASADFLEEEDIPEGFDRAYVMFDFTPFSFDVLTEEVLSNWGSASVLNFINAEENADVIRAAAEDGLDVAQLILGMMYTFGRGTDQDVDMAFEWLHLAASQGVVRALFNIGVVYQQIDDAEQSVYWYKQAAELEHVLSQHNMGVFYRDGWGVSQNYEQSVYWFRRAASQGSSYINLGWMYQTGRGVPQSYEQALYWYRRAVEANHSGGTAQLAYMYLNGLGVDQCYDTAIYWLTLAAAQGNEWAQEQLDELTGE